MHLLSNRCQIVVVPITTACLIVTMQLKLKQSCTVVEGEKNAWWHAAKAAASSSHHSTWLLSLRQQFVVCTSFHWRTSTALGSDSAPECMISCFPGPANSLSPSCWRRLE